MDRWKINSSGVDEAPAHFQESLTSSDTGPWAKGFRYALKIRNGNQTSGAGAADYIFTETKLEAQDIAHSGWDYTNTNSKITLSFWIKSSVAQTFYGRLLTYDGTILNYPFSTGSLSANTWTKITKTIPGHASLQFDSNNAEGLAVILAPFMGTDYTDSGVTLDAWATYGGGTRMPDYTSTWYTTDDSTFHITGVQLEAGDTATEFEHRPYNDVLLQCERYYQVIVDRTLDTQGNATNSVFFATCWAYDNHSAWMVVPFRQVMRVKPSHEITTGTDFWKFVMGATAIDITGTGFASDDSSTRNWFYKVALGTNSTTQGYGGGCIAWSGSCRLAYSAEL